MEKTSRYSHLLQKTRLPQPTFQRYAVVSIFQSLQSSLSDLDSDVGRDALYRCLTSTSPTVVDQSVRELCRLVKSGRGPLDASRGLIELLAALDACESRFVDVFVKAIGFLCRFRVYNDPSWGRSFSSSPLLHPFVKVLSCRFESSDELIRQVVLFISYGLPVGVNAVCEFLRPFLIFSVLRTQSSEYMASFTKDLMSSIATLCCTFPNEAVPIVRILVGSLRFFPSRNKKELKYLFDSATYLVDTFIIILKQFDRTEKLGKEINECFVELLDTIFSVCFDHHKSFEGIGMVVELSNRVLAPYKELGWDYLPEFVSIMLSLSIILIQVEFEHEQLSILKLLVYLVEWKNETCFEARDTSYLNEELLLVFPVMNLVSSPSISVKDTATYLLSILQRHLVGTLVAVKKQNVSVMEIVYPSKLVSIIERLLCHLCSQDQSSLVGFYLLESPSVQKPVMLGRYEQTMSWMYEVKDYSFLSMGSQKFKHTFQTQEACGPKYQVTWRTVLHFHSSASTLIADQILQCTGMPMLLCTVASFLIRHPKFGCCAVESFSAIGHADPKACLPILLTILYYCKIFCNSAMNYQEVLIKLLETLPSLASHSVMLPLVLQTILPMLHQDTNPVLRATAIQLLCKTWMASGRSFVSLQGILDSKAIAEFVSQRDISISIASSVRDVCKHDPDRGIDLILSVSSCIESRDSSLQALGLESVAYLCEADAIDFYTAWNVIVKTLLDYTKDPVVAHSLCILLRWGAMDAEAYPEESQSIVQILWAVGTSRDTHSGSLWPTARISAFNSLAHYDVGLLQKKISNFKEKNAELLLCEDDDEVLNALEQFETNIINFEHITRRRLLKGKRQTANKVEKLLELFPQAIFPSGELNYAKDLPGAALLSFVFTPKEYQTKATLKDLPKITAAYENKLLEIAESLQLSRNVFCALLAVQSWKTFIGHWMKAISIPVDTKANLHGGTSRASDDILKIMCSAAEISVPRTTENITLAIGALCMVVQPSAESVVFAASEFLLKWLLQYEHEHRQWSAAISLGLVSNCLHVTDRPQKYAIISELLKVLDSSESYLVKGACGIGLGFACQDLLTINEVDNSNSVSTRMFEATVLKKIVRSLSLAISNICPSSYDSLSTLEVGFSLTGEHTDTEESANMMSGDPELFEGDVWGVAGLVMGLGYSIMAIYRFGAYDTVLKIKDMLISWVPFVGSSQNSLPCGAMPETALSVGSCIAFPTVVSFCQRAELMRNNEIDVIFSGYRTLLLEILSVNKPARLHLDLLMASCIGSGSLLSCVLDNGMHSLEIDVVKSILEAMRNTYMTIYPPAIHFSGMLGVVNAFGAGAGLLTKLFSPTVTLESNYVQEQSSFLHGPILRSHILEPLYTSIIQEMFLLAKDHTNQQRRYASWALSFLRHRWLSKGFQGVNGPQDNLTSSKPISESLSVDSLVWKLYVWLLHLQSSEIGVTAHFNTIAKVLACLRKAPRLPFSSDWGPIIRRCLNCAAQNYDNPHLIEACQVLREECIQFSLAHANFIEPLLIFLDEQTDLARFRKLELNLQACLLSHVFRLLKNFSFSRWGKLCEDLIEYLGSSTSSYFHYKAHQKMIIRISFWKGLCQCLTEITGSSVYEQTIENCMGKLFNLLPSITFENSLGEDQSRIEEEWSVAIQCLTKARLTWVMDTLQVVSINHVHLKISADDVRKILAMARLVRAKHIPIAEIGKLKVIILNARSEGTWNALIEVAKVVGHAEDNVRRQWLIDAVDISIVSRYPSTALQFVGILSGFCCKYMPLLTVNPVTVLSDLPITLSSLLMDDDSWAMIAEDVAAKLFMSADRIYTWVSKLHDGHDTTVADQIDPSENDSAALLSSVMLQACVSLKHYIPFDKQLRLANMSNVRGILPYQT